LNQGGGRVFTRERCHGPRVQWPGCDRARTRRSRRRRRLTVAPTAASAGLTLIFHRRRWSSDSRSAPFGLASRWSAVATLPFAHPLPCARHPPAPAARARADSCSRVAQIDKRRKLFKKVDSMMQKVRESFREMDTDGDSILTASEVRAMLRETDRSITQEELNIVEDFIWGHDDNGDQVLSYHEFVKGFDLFREELRDASVKAAGMEAYAKLAHSGLLQQIFDSRKELLQNIQKRTADRGFRDCTNEILEEALREMHLNLNDAQIGTFIIAANLMQAPHFDPTDILNMAAKRFDDYADEANAGFGRGVAHEAKAPTRPIRSPPLLLLPAGDQWIDRHGATSSKECISFMASRALCSWWRLTLHRWARAGNVA